MHSQLLIFYLNLIRKRKKSAKAFVQKHASTLDIIMVKQFYIWRIYTLIHVQLLILSQNL